MVSLWNIPDISNLRTPITIIKEQATALSEATGGLLRGDVTTSRSAHDETLFLTLSVIVPALNNYKYNILTYWQPVRLFPGDLHYSAENKVYRISNEKEFDERLKSILGSEEVGAVIGALIAQARDLSGG
jgi:hypothetical protein